MHRLLTAKTLYPYSVYNISAPLVYSHESTALRNGISCSFCRKILRDQNNIENVLLVRHQSTRTANSLHKFTKKKAKYKKPKKYGEVLEVNDKAMTESKVSISNLRAVHLSKLATSSVSLGQLHQLTTSTPSLKNNSESVDEELLRKFSNEILKRNYSCEILENVHLEDDKCALLYTSHKISYLNKFKTKQYMDMVKESYNTFRKQTLYDQRLKDLSCAINEGLNQEFDLTPPLPYGHQEVGEDKMSQQKGALAIFRELFSEHQQSHFHIDNLAPELIAHMSQLQTRGIPHPAIEEIYDDSVLHNELEEPKEELDFDPLEIPSPVAKTLKVKKIKDSILLKNKERREKRRVNKEREMKGDLQEMERRGKEEALNKLLAAHLELLCSLGMLQQGRQILQYYRSRSTKSADQPKINNNKVYNILLQGYAAVGDYDTLNELLSFMEIDNVEANVQTYAAVFECIERGNSADKVSLLNQHQQAMAAKGLTLNDILDKSKFLRDQRQTVLTAIRRLDPHFEPQYTPPDLDYMCPLLDSLNDPQSKEGLRESPAEGLLSLEELKKRALRQLDIEIKGEIEVENIELKGEPTESILQHRQKLGEAEKEWRTVVREAFIRNLSTLKSQSNASHSAITLYPYLRILEVDQFVTLIIGEIRKLVDGSETYSPTLKLLQRELGSQVYHRYQIEQYRQNGVLEKIKRLYERYCEWYVTRKLGDVPCNGRQAWQTLLHQDRTGPCLDVEETPWPIDVRQNIGKFLYNIIINDIKIDVNMFKTKTTKQKKLPAVYKVHRQWGRMVRLEIKPHPLLARLCRGAASPELSMRAQLVPLACPAAPWPSLRAGAYLLTSTPLIRMPYNVVQQWKRLEEAPPVSLYPVLDSLNQLGEVPWVINQPILDLQLQVFRSGGSKQLDIPQPPSALNTAQFEGGDSKASAFRRRVAINRTRAEMYSLWCDALYKLSLANHYRKEIFWLPHNMDFRGRVYACPPHLSQLGADSARALLTFARQRPLGERGLRWLKLHAINLTGTMKKNTLDERLEYAESIMDKILDSADRPLEGQRWWAQSEEPWQTLACCKEIANAVRSPCPEEYMCGFPVHQDGSCNGLQHYAALGGDSAGAAAVNLHAIHTPQDVYSAVAVLVEEMRTRDAAAGVTAAAVLDGFVRRKVIKQTIMTTVYGVTRFGARLQIAKQLKDIDNFPKEHIWGCSSYLTTKTFDSLREMFTATKEIQDWFTDCAKVISGVCGESVEWVTPLGLPVVQPYHRRMQTASSKSANSGTITHKAALDCYQRPCTVKQKNAFPPNFIHSLDSTHMMLTGLWCQARGVTFISVHDCFWTHPDTVDAMNEICRQQFVALHSQPILEDLSKFLVERYSYDQSEISDEESKNNTSKRRVNKVLGRVPSKGDFELENVLRSVYFFS